MEEGRRAMIFIGGSEGEGVSFWMTCERGGWVRTEVFMMGYWGEM